MAENVVNTFDLYNTTNYWGGYNFPGFPREQTVTFAYYTAQFSSNPVGSQVDFFREVAGNRQQNPSFSILSTTGSVSGYTIDTMPYLWGKYWWDHATYYSHPITYSIISQTDPAYYQVFGESAGSLYFLSYVNNLQNASTKCYNPIIETLLNINISTAIDAFYSVANTLFLTNKVNLGPGAGTDTAPGTGPNATLIQADTDLNRRIASLPGIKSKVNTLYPALSAFLLFNNVVIGNMVTPYTWSLSANCEGSDIFVDFTNRNTQSPKQLVTNDLKAD
jgi:hypothetical protein